MKRKNILFFFLFISYPFLNAQVVVRCPTGIFRCVPTEESRIDSYTITPCDCNNPENIYADKNYCKRTITLHTNNPKIPTVITAFDFPYFTLEPLSMSFLRGPNLQQLVSYMDPTGSIDPNLSSDAQDIALLLEIDPVSGNASFDAWVPMDEEHTIRVYTDVVTETGNQWRFIAIPSSDCDEVQKSCYFFNSGNIAVPIPNNGFVFSGINVPLDGKLADIRINNINISHGRPFDLGVRLLSPYGTEMELFTRDICADGFNSPNINMGFEATGPLSFPCPATDGNLYSPRGSFQDAFRDPNVTGSWNLRLEDVFSGFSGTLNFWEIEICIVKEICGPFIKSSHAPIGVGPKVGTITSVINIPDQGTVQGVKISNLYVQHNNLSDLKISLRSPSGTTRIIMDQECNGFDQYNMAFDDDAAATNIICAGLPFGRAKPAQTFSAFNGQESQGDWTLIIEDLFNMNGGQLISWELDICTDCISNYATASNNNLKGSLPIDYSYKARQNIESQQRLIGASTTTNVNYQASTSIQLQKEFEVQSGVNFEAVIDNCN